MPLFEVCVLIIIKILKGDYEKDLQQQLMPQQDRLMNSDLAGDLLTPAEETVEEVVCSRCCGPEDMDGFLEQFMQKHCGMCLRIIYDHSGIYLIPTCFKIVIVCYIWLKLVDVLLLPI